MVFFLIMILFITPNLVNASAEDKEMLMNPTDSTVPIIFHTTGEPVLLPKVVIPEKQQFRGLYVYTDQNLDFGQQSSIDAFKAQFLDILAKLEDYHMNTIIFEIRPLNDAFYSSTLNPWSKYLTGNEDEDPGWDPLQWMISETHANNMYFHAGFNAYKVSNKTTLSKGDFIKTLSEKNYAFKNPGDVISTEFIDGQFQYFLNPAQSKVQQFILDSIVEIVTHYDIDALNLEDFFYPPSFTNQYGDEIQYNQSKNKGLSIDDWRRDNINNLIINIKEEITYYNTKNQKYIQLGVTPYGVWANSTDNKEGSYTTGYSSYDSEYADIRYWIKNEYIDYVAPQIEWGFEDLTHPYADLVEWWVNVVKDTDVNLYIGQGITKDWSYEDQVLDQLRFNQNYHEIKGSLLFNYHNFNNTNDTITHTLNGIKTIYWKQSTLYPTILTLSNNEPKAVDRLLVTYINNYVTLSWNQLKSAKFYIIYRFKNEEPINLADTSHIIKIINSSNQSKVTFMDKDIAPNNVYNYLITSMDYVNKESIPVTFGVSTYANEMFQKELFLFILTGSITLLVIGYSSFITLRNIK